jgi:hypothetical protein
MMLATRSINKAVIRFPTRENNPGSFARSEPANRGGLAPWGFGKLRDEPYPLPPPHLRSAASIQRHKRAKTEGGAGGVCRLQVISQLELTEFQIGGMRRVGVITMRSTVARASQSSS